MSVFRRTFVGWGVIPNLIIGVFIALIVWVVTWRYLMPLLLGIKYSWSDSKLWSDSLIYPGINVIFILAAASVGVLFSMFAGYMTILSAFFVILMLLPVAFGLPGLIYLITRHQYRMDYNRGKPVLAYIVVILVSNIAYLALGYGYAQLIGIA
jgi:hypothetical protein